jgi:hypothetical protein
MNRTRALEILGLFDEDDDAIKKAYRIKILQYHPDKNRSAEATDRFREIQDAYAFLKTTSSLGSDLDTDSDADASYNEILRLFLSRILEEEYAEIAAPFVVKILEILVSRIINFIDGNSVKLLAYLKNINRPTLVFIYGILSKYRGAFHLPNGVFEKIGEILRGGSGGGEGEEDVVIIGSEAEEEYIVLNPTLDDLFSDENVYKLKYGEGTYLVPLWHHDVVFDREGKDLLVKCFPVLPENMELDEWNNLTVELEYSVSDVWNRMVCVDIGGKALEFDGRTLHLTSEPQKILLPSCGVSHNNTSDIFDVSQKQDILLIIHLHH